MGRCQEELISKAQIRYIQTVRREHGIEDDLYDQMKASVGVSSTTQLTRRQFNELLRRIDPKAGNAGASSPARARAAKAKAKDQRPAAWKPVHKSAYKSGMHRQPPEETEAMIRKIEAILADMKLHWAYVDGMVKRMFGIERLRWCDDDQTYKVLQALVIHQKRTQEKGESDGTSDEP